jgi:hypothetical protein
MPNRIVDVVDALNAGVASGQLLRIRMAHGNDIALILTRDVSSLRF